MSLGYALGSPFRTDGNRPLPRWVPTQEGAMRLNLA